jgi:hypothetical protein
LVIILPYKEGFEGHFKTHRLTDISENNGAGHVKTQDLVEFSPKVPVGQLFTQELVILSA